jgi:ubiquinone/menaquinone biosynthesis C-methylase UbiE
LEICRVELTKAQTLKSNLEKIMLSESKVNNLVSKLGDMSFKRRFLKLIEILNKEMINDKIRVLDVGCGEGFYVVSLNTLTDFEIVGVEYDLNLVESTQNWVTSIAQKKDNVPLILNGDATKLKFEDNFFDFVLCSEVLEHINDDVQAVNEIYRVLKPGGKVFVTVPNINYPFLWDPLNWVRKFLRLGHFSPMNTWLGGVWSYDHKRLYSCSEIKKLMIDSGFRVEDVSVLTHYGLPFNILMLQVFKKFFTSNFVPRSVKDSAEKFSVLKKNSSDIFRTLLYVLNFFDRLNNTKFNLSKSTMNITVLAQK